MTPRCSSTSASRCSYQHRWAEALDAFDRARDAGLDSSDLHRYRAHALHQLGRTDEAVEACRAWLERDPGGAARGYLAVLEMDRGQLAEAYRQAEALLQAETPTTPTRRSSPACTRSNIRRSIARARTSTSCSSSSRTTRAAGSASG